MADKTGALIVVEGTANTGIDHQFDKLHQRLIAAGYEVATFQFPRLDDESSYFLRKYEQNGFGITRSVSPYTASLFYALDRYSVLAQISADLAAGKVVLSTGYTGATMASQGVKFTQPEQRRGYFIWLDNLESQMLGMTRPDQNLVLTTTAVSEKENVVSELTVFVDLCTLFPKDFQRVEISRNKQLVAPETVHEQLWKLVEPYLPELIEETEPVVETGQTTKPPYSVPDSLEGEVRSAYIESLDTLYKSYGRLSTELEKYLHVSSPKTAALEAKKIASLVLPAAGTKTISTIPALTNHGGTYDEAIGSALRLTAFWPHNEMELSSHLSPETAKELNYEGKSKLISNFLMDLETYPGLAKKVSYTFTVQSDFASIAALVQTGLFVTYSIQPLTPRNGFAVPQELEEAGLADVFEACFDASSMLFSLLQKNTLHQEAQFATLLGHKAQAEFTISISDLGKLHALKKTESILDKMLELISEKHPLIFSMGAVK